MVASEKKTRFTHRAPATAFPRKKHNPILTPISGPRARPMR